MLFDLLVTVKPYIIMQCANFWVLWFLTWTVVMGVGKLWAGDF